MPVRCHRASEALSRARLLALFAALLAPMRASAVAFTEAPTVAQAGSQVTISWKTDVSASTEVHYGLVSQLTAGAYGNHSVFPGLAGLLHSRTLADLPPGTYFFRARSAVPAAGAVESAEGTFVVAGGTSRPLGVGVSVNGTVYAVARSGPVLYFGGAFTRVGLAAGAGQMVDGTTGALLADQPRPDGRVISVAPDGNGGLYIAGDFTRVGGLFRAGVAHLLPDMGVDPGFDAKLGSASSVSVYAVTVAAGAVYIVGNITSAGGQPRSYAAAVDAVTGAPKPWNPAFTITPECLAANATTLFVGGGFGDVGGQPRDGVAAFDLATGNLTGWSPPASTSAVRVLAVAGTTLLVGDGPLIRALDPTATNTTKWTAATNGGVVRALVPSGSQVFVGGNFTAVNAAPRQNVVALSLASGGVLPWNPDVNGEVEGLQVSGSTVYLGGLFSKIGGVDAARAGSVDATSGAKTAWNPAPNGDIIAVGVAGAGIFLGGSISGANPTAFNTVPRNNVAAFDTAAGTIMAWDPNVDATVRAVDVLPGQVFLGGSFTTVNGGTVRNHAAAFDDTSGAALPWDPNLDGVANALVATPSTIYVAGAFQHVNGGLARRFAAAFASANVATATGWSPAPSTAVTSLALTGSRIFLGLSGMPTAIYATDLTTGAQASFNATTSNAITALTPIGGAVCAGGLFTVAGSQPHLRSACFDASTGTVSATWNPSFDADVYATASTGATSYWGGSFHLVNGVPQNYLAALDATGASVGPTVTLDNYVYAIKVSCADGLADFGGAFRVVGGEVRQGVFTLPVSCGGLGPPAVTTAGASVTDTTAMVKGGVNPNGDATLAWFRYAAGPVTGCDDTFGTRAPTTGGIDVGSGTGQVIVTTTVSGLTPSTTYSYCSIAKNSFGVSFGALKTFTTAQTSDSGVVDAGALDAGAAGGGGGASTDGGLGGGAGGGAAGGGAAGGGAAGGVAAGGGAAGGGAAGGGAAGGGAAGGGAVGALSFDTSGCGCTAGNGLEAGIGLAIAVLLLRRRPGTTPPGTSAASSGRAAR